MPFSSKQDSPLCIGNRKRIRSVCADVIGTMMMMMMMSGEEGSRTFALLILSFVPLILCQASALDVNFHNQEKKQKEGSNGSDDTPVIGHFTVSPLLRTLTTNQSAAPIEIVLHFVSSKLSLTTSESRVCLFLNNQSALIMTFRFTEGNKLPRQDLIDFSSRRLIPCKAHNISASIISSNRSVKRLRPFSPFDRSSSEELLTRRPKNFRRVVGNENPPSVKSIVEDCDGPPRKIHPVISRISALVRGDT
ncbi:hypothetical protein F2P81_008344 [Scophthalmus maximus]|uniref:Uncharacterized protein n=1 Tax=Scophthalmus maximus TaxID=52904 RepID=A0A6A4T5A4_SCOMX|nr:hypothetical protein F2P81_008344 [Scophthalmus maximus]